MRSYLQKTINLCANGKLIISLMEHGDIYVKGKLIENDIEVVQGMRELLRLK